MSNRDKIYAHVGLLDENTADSQNSCDTRKSLPLAFVASLALFLVVSSSTPLALASSTLPLSSSTIKRLSCLGPTIRLKLFLAYNFGTARLRGINRSYYLLEMHHSVINQYLS